MFLFNIPLYFYEYKGKLGCLLKESSNKKVVFLRVFFFFSPFAGLLASCWGCNARNYGCKIK